MIVGSDRIPEFSKTIPKYNGVEGKPHGFYNFESIDFQSAGERDPDAEGVAGMSASKLRGFAVAGDYDNFKKGNNLNDRGLKFNNPSAKGQCGCRTSFMIEVAEEHRTPTWM